MSFKHIVLLVSLTLLLIACGQHRPSASQRAHDTCTAHGLTPADGKYWTTCVHDLATVYGAPTESMGVYERPDAVILVAPTY